MDLRMSNESSGPTISNKNKKKKKEKYLKLN